jgi:spermidine/putrescine transport system permease protein
MTPLRLTLYLVTPCVILLGVTMVAPMLVMLVFSVGDRAPDGGYAAALTLGQYAAILTRLGPIGSSIQLGLVCTLLCMLFGTAGAYAVYSVSDPKWKVLLLLIIMLPFFTSFVARAYAWYFLLGGKGIPSLLQQLGLGSLRLLNTQFAVLLGVVYAYLPIAILSVVVAMERIPRSLLEASSDLGRGEVSTFFHIVLPLAMPGVVSGASIVFIFAAGEYLIPAMLGGGRIYLAGNSIADLMLQSRNWPLGAALAIVLVAVILGAVFGTRWMEQKFIVWNRRDTD